MKKNARRTDIIIVIVLVLIAAALVLVHFTDRKQNGRASSTMQNGAAVTYTDYNGKTVGILSGTNMEDASFKFFPDSEYLYFDGYADLNTALMNGKIDAYLGDEPALNSIPSSLTQLFSYHIYFQIVT